MAYKMIDVSSWQGNIDWNKVKADGVTGAIIRAGFDNDTVDNRFIRNINGAIKAGIHIGIYWFSYAYTDAMARSEADFCIKVIAPYKKYIDMPVFFDWEYDSMNYAKKQGVYPSKQLITSMTKVFCDRLKAAGYMAGVYYNYDYKINHYDLSQLKGCYKWYALYTDERANGADIQQYSSTGKVNGISGNCDMNRCYVKFWKNDKPTLKPTTDNDKLETDGIFGKLSTERLQKVLGIDPDGWIGGQTESCKPYLMNWTTIRYNDGFNGSVTINKLQRYLDKRGYSVGKIDGLCGKNTVTALQKFLNAHDFNCGKPDGYFGANTAKAFQKYLNAL